MCLMTGCDSVALQRTRGQRHGLRRLMRLFVAVDIDNAIRERITSFVDRLRSFAPDARWVKEESLHVTLKFIGEQPDAAVDRIKQALAKIAFKPVQIRFTGYGFFPNEKSARVFWVGMEADPDLASLAAEVDHKLAVLGVPKEERKFSPHLTLARIAGGSGSPRWRKGDRPRSAFAQLQKNLAADATQEFGEMTVRDFFLYRSQLSPKGSTYTKLARFGSESDKA